MATDRRPPFPSCSLSLSLASFTKPLGCRKWPPTSRSSPDDNLTHLRPFLYYSPSLFGSRGGGGRCGAGPCAEWRPLGRQISQMVEAVATLVVAGGLGLCDAGSRVWWRPLRRWISRGVWAVEAPNLMSGSYCNDVSPIFLSLLQSETLSNNCIESINQK
ncbi:hypothetical protein L484_005806 [Morus notabilis]|uniref:Uncharacterized protein n=1 Tax=Morus notabilis TaxID=981085 RepID=W9S2J2_9ROSA|nr:hypothetical protein L484_005806 [Morus notabilis]